MTREEEREEIARLAREAGFNVSENASFADAIYISMLYRFAHLIAAAEREACEKVASDYVDYQRSLGDEYAELRAMGALEAMEGAGMNLGKSPSTLWQMMKLDDEWKARLEAAVAAEREACAVLVETLLGENPDLSEVFIAAEIRARGKDE